MAFTTNPKVGEWVRYTEADGTNYNGKIIEFDQSGEFAGIEWTGTEYDHNADFYFLGDTENGMWESDES